jgi:hypothetical protein
LALAISYLANVSKRVNAWEKTMSRNYLKCMSGALLAGLLAAFVTVTSAAHPSMSQEVDGLTVYLGVTSANRLAAHPELLPKAHPIRNGNHMHHILVAIFDNTTGERIVDAEIEATVSPLAVSGPTKIMHPWASAGKMTYCNFFRLSAGDTYVIRVRIRRPGTQAVRIAEFTLKRFSA